MCIVCVVKLLNENKNCRRQKKRSSMAHCFLKQEKTNNNEKITKKKLRKKIIEIVKVMQLLQKKLI